MELKYTQDRDYFIPNLRSNELHTYCLEIQHQAEDRMDLLMAQMATD